MTIDPIGQTEGVRMRMCWRRDRCPQHHFARQQPFQQHLPEKPRDHGESAPHQDDGPWQQSSFRRRLPHPQPHRRNLGEIDHASDTAAVGEPQHHDRQNHRGHGGAPRTPKLVRERQRTRCRDGSLGLSYLGGFGWGHFGGFSMQQPWVARTKVPYFTVRTM